MELLVAQVGRGLQLLRPHPGGCGQTEEPQSWNEPAGHCPLQSRPGVQGLAGSFTLHPKLSLGKSWPQEVPAKTHTLLGPP